MEMQSLAFPPPPGYLDAFRAIHDALKPTGPLDGTVSLVVIAILPGLCEELVVRGALLPSLVGRLGPGGAVVGSAFLFAAMHADPYRFLFTLTIGLVLGLLRLRTGSLWPPVLAHVTLNALTFAIAPLVDDPVSAVHAATRPGPRVPRRRGRGRLAPAAGAGPRERSARTARLIALSESPAILGG